MQYDWEEKQSALDLQRTKEYKGKVLKAEEYIREFNRIPKGFDGNKHYTARKIQPWDAMEEWMTPEQFNGFLLGNAIKYLGRCNHKDSWESDLLKAKHYIEKLLEERNAR